MSRAKDDKQIVFEPEGFTLFSYATVQAIPGGMAKAGNADLEAVAKTVRSITVDTVVGPVTFGQNGNIKGPNFDINV